MNKSELISAVAKEAHITRAEATPVVEAVFNAITATLASGESVHLNSFGAFEVKHREARTGFNPRTRQPFDVPAKNVVTFKPANALKEHM